MTTRREFIRQIAILLASLTATHCTPLAGQGSTPTPEQSNTPRDRLRTCWLSFDQVQEQAQEDFRRGEETMDRLEAEHRAALDELVAAEELRAATAEEVQVIYAEALSHIRGSLATCYEAVSSDFQFDAREQLIQQTDLLAQVAAKGDLDPQTVAQAQAALEQDVAYLNLSTEARERVYNELVAAGSTYPSFAKVELEVGPEAAEAARFLIDLLLGQ